MSPKEEIITKKAPSAIGPYSQAVKVGSFLFCSGQIPMDPASGEIVEGGIETQTKQVLKNLKAVIEKAGGSMSSVVKTTVYLSDIADFPKFNQIYATFFQKPYPARATMEVANLPKGVKIEIEAIAYLE